MTPTRLPLLVLSLLVISGPVTAQAPARQRLLMDYGWRFTRGDPAGAEAPGFDDAGWRAVDLPHDWSIEGPYDQHAPTGGSGGYLPTGIGWYRRAFTRPAGPRGSRVTVEFDGVYQNSDVWINGHHLGNRPNGYISFHYDLTPHLRAGSNVVAVRVDNSRQPNTRWYSGSGIYRHVWLTVTGPLHVGQWGTYLTTPEVDTATAQVAVRTRIVNDGTGERRGTLRSVISDAAGPGERPGALVTGFSGALPSADLCAGSRGTSRGSDRHAVRHPDHRLRRRPRLPAQREAREDAGREPAP
jgi:beta-galactosidase